MSRRHVQEFRSPPRNMQDYTSIMKDYIAKSEATVSVKVVGLAGEEVAAMHLPTASTIWAVKENLMPICSLPPERQQLLLVQPAATDNEQPLALPDNRRLDELG